MQIDYNHLTTAVWQVVNSHELPNLINVYVDKNHITLEFAAEDANGRADLRVDMSHIDWYAGASTPETRHGWNTEATAQLALVGSFWVHRVTAMSANDAVDGVMCKLDFKEKSRATTLTTVQQAAYAVTSLVNGP